MRAAIQAFNQIYTCSNDADLQSRALIEYNATHPTFQYLQEWEYLRRSSKFHIVSDWDPKSTRCEPSAKRSKTTSGSADPQSQGSDARVNFDLNTTEAEGETWDARYYRPSGRDAAKKAAHAGSSGSSGKDNYLEEFDKLGEKLEGLTEVGNQRVEFCKQHIDLQ